MCALFFEYYVETLLFVTAVTLLLGYDSIDWRNEF